LSWVVVIWLVGTIAFWVRLIGSWVVAAGMRSTRVWPAPKEWQHILSELGVRIGLFRPVRLLISAVVQVPTVVGWLRPIVLMPIGALSGLPPEHIEALLLHELAHVRRYDYLVNILQGIAETLLFYHPAVWWVSSHIRTERELCCDDVAVSVTGDVLTYARALAELESFRPAHLNAVIAVNGGSLAARIARLLSLPQPRSRTSSGPGVIISAALIAATACGIFVILLFAFTVEAQTPAAVLARAGMSQGVRAFEEARYDAAIKYFQDAINLDPRLTDAELYLAKAYSQRFVPGIRSPQNQAFADKAIAAFDNVLKTEPNNITAIAGLASVYQNANQPGKAREYYLRIEQLNPFNPQAFYSVGALDWIIANDKQTTRSPEESARLVQEGLQHLDIALALNPDHEDAMTYKNLLLREQAQLASGTEKSRLVSEADQSLNKALEIRRKNQTADQSSPNRLAQIREDLSQPAAQSAPLEQAIDQSGRALQQLTDQTLLLQQAKNMGLSADIEIIKIMDHLRQDRNLPTMQALEKEIAARGSTIDEFKEQIRIQYLTSQVLQREVYPNVVVSNEDMRKYYDAHVKDFDRPAGIHLREITIITANRGPEDIASQRKKAEEALAAVKKGDDFGATASRYSESPTAKDGGDLGFFAKGELSPWMEEAGNKLERGQISEIITAPGALMIFKLDDKHDGGILPFELARNEVADILWKQAVTPKVKEYLTKLRSGAFVK